MSNTSSPSRNRSNVAASQDQRGQMAALRAAAVASVTQEDIQEVMAALSVQAKKGNVAAVRLFLAYTIGKPADSGRSAARVEDDQAPQELADHAGEATSDPPAELPAMDSLRSLTLPAHLDSEQPPRVNARARAELRRAERKRRKAERKKARQLQLDPARKKAELAPSRNGPIEPNSPLAIGSNSPAAPSLNSV